MKKKIPEGQQFLKEKVQSMLTLTKGTVETIQRISTELRPGVLDHLGLAAALEWQANEFQTRSGISCKVICDFDDSSLDKYISTVLFRIFQESLTNVVRHARATEVHASLEEEDSHLLFTVKDNGRVSQKRRLRIITLSGSWG